MYKWLKFKSNIEENKILRDSTFMKLYVGQIINPSIFLDLLMLTLMTSSKQGVINVTPGSLIVDTLVNVVADNGKVI